MQSTVYYLARSRTDGRYLVARSPANTNPEATPATYVLVFQEHYDALTYLNTHASGLADQFAIESVSGNQLGTVLERWKFSGVGIVHDPLLPRVEFLSR